MLHGNLSADVQPRLLIVFEGILGFLPPGRLAEYNQLGSAGRWDRAMGLWDLNGICMQKIVDLAIRKNQQIEIVTYVAPPEGAEALSRRFDEENLPVSRVIASTPQRTARRLPYAPDVACVYDVDARNVMMYGSRGRHITNVHQLGR